MHPTEQPYYSPNFAVACFQFPAPFEAYVVVSEANRLDPDYGLDLIIEVSDAAQDPPMWDVDKGHRLYWKDLYPGSGGLPTIAELHGEVIRTQVTPPGHPFPEEFTIKLVAVGLE